MSVPRTVIAAPASGQGKTTVAVGIMAALVRSGHRVAPFKVGPDYIDPGYHALATGRPGRNLDPWLVGEERINPLLLHGFSTPQPADIAVIEGVMGLFDGRLGDDGFASTAHVASLTRSPVLLVVDISSAARTVAALVHGLRGYDPSQHIAGVVLNKAGSDRHAAEARRAVEAIGVPVLGVLPRDAGMHVPSRHLGLVPAAERDGASAALDFLADRTAQHIDLEQVLAVAESAPPLEERAWSPASGSPVSVPTRIAVAGGRAFTFRYAETDELLRAAGCEPVVFDPATASELPTGTRGLYLGGGFPEVHAQALSGNRALLSEIRDAVLSGMPTVAECAGLLYLSQSLDGFPMVGAVPASAAMHSSLVIGYRSATLTTDSIIGDAGLTVRTHEFHRTRTSPDGGTRGAWSVDGAPVGFALDPARTGRATVHASYLHLHWAGAPDIAYSFAHAAAAFAPAARPSASSTQIVPVERSKTSTPDPLEHHGDADLAPGLVDLAVNVRIPQPPEWLRDEIASALPGLGAYPSTASARPAIARRHGVPEAMVLPTNGGAEAFILIARAIEGRRLVVVHPQFTEPEAALRRAGRVPERVLLSPDDGFRLRADSMAGHADLVCIGNPTNPTGVLHPRVVLEQFRSRSKVLVVDEAFMDAVPDERETLIGPDMAGVLVVRSLTKTWGIAGLRAGYVVGDPALIAQLERQQGHWSVSAPAAAAMVATASLTAAHESAAAAIETVQWREHLVSALAVAGFAPVPGSAPFVLVRVGAGVREALRTAGFAVRRCDTFPGLDDEWVRIAVREPRVSDALVRALTTAVVTDPEARAYDVVTRVPDDEDAQRHAVPSHRGATMGSVTLVGGGPGDPGLLTLAGLQALQAADVVVCDRLAPLSHLPGLGPDVEVVHVGKIPRGAFTPQEDINALLIDRAHAGKRVVRFKGGDNFVFGRGGEEWNACVDAGVPVRVVPGVSSAIAAPALAGIPVTHREVTQGFIVLSGHVPPDDPSSTIDWDAVASSGLTIVVLMGVATLDAIARLLMERGLDADTPAACISNAGMPQQQVVRAALRDLANAVAEAGLRHPAVTVIGHTTTALHGTDGPAAGSA